MKDHLSAIRIELLSADNILPLTEMTLALWPGCDVDDECATWRDICGNVRQYCALARVDDAYAGFIHISIRQDYVEGSDADETAYLEGIFVWPAYRNRGVASLLLQHGEQWVKSKGLRQLASDTEIGNLSSQRFHGKAGFEEVNRVVCYLKRI